MVKRTWQETANDKEESDGIALPTTRYSDEPVPKKVKWINKQRVLVFATRRISHRDRHLMEDIKTLMPHCKTESKMERTENLFVVNEICEMKNCNKCILFEGRHKRDLYLWISNVPTGPCAKFLVENTYTMAELKFTGNCLKGSRPLLSFDENFTKYPHYALLKELFVQVFGTPNKHPRSQPFIDHVFTFSVLDNRIWFRNFQILSEDGALTEIGPRFVLNPVKIFGSSFGGQTLWENASYISPAKYRQQIAKAASGKYINRIEQKVAYEKTKPKESYKLDETDDIFHGDPIEKAAEIASKEGKSLKLKAKVRSHKLDKKKRLLKKNLKKKKKKNRPAENVQ
ncbi:ribosome biogenesis protein BRX1 homolog [Schistocerca serialis cubense]|uniref:ribosome biogenesis protein BRX1 homolog n=1 Tax=Schistocerca serialis cubense TaxID=2023355 RepID=UPI00214F25DD|nr:ribosome biogenesis protein BRX1 homolog [Schistocerca serialis cubense]